MKSQRKSTSPSPSQALEPTMGDQSAASGVGNAARAEQLQSRSGGLPADVLATMEASFGVDFSGVQVHEGGPATAMGAQAFTQGEDLWFAPGAFDPSSQEGQALIGHELAHVVQQRDGRVASTGQAKGGVNDDGGLEREADTLGLAAARGQSVNAGRGSGKATGGGPLQANTELTADQITAAGTWAGTADIGTEAISALQTALGVTASGTYDEATIRAVFAQQKQWQPNGAVTGPGQARAAVFQRLGLIFTTTIANATVGDPDLATIQDRFPDGVTIAIVPDFKNGVSGRTEFFSQASIFAANQQAVGLTGGAIVLGEAIRIEEAGDAIEAVQSIHRGLEARWRASLDTGAEGPAPEVPAWTKVKNLALFSHGEDWGMGFNADNDFSQGGLHSNTTRSGRNPANTQAFADGVRSAVGSAVRVQLFACSAGADTDRTSYEEWTRHEQGDRSGNDSFGESLQTAMGEDATVYAHTTVGHTTENFAARVFGAESGEGEGGVHAFELMYPETFVSTEVQRLFPADPAETQLMREPSMREQMWAHFKDSITGEHGRPNKRYAVPMGQEMFVNPSNARTLFHADFTTWIAGRLRLVRPVHNRQ